MANLEHSNNISKKGHAMNSCEVIHPKVAKCAKFLLIAILVGAYFCFAPQAVVTSDAQQSARATLSGVVKDPQGALVPGAQVSITQKGTDSTLQTTTNDEGLYVFPSLPVGEYTVTVSLKGFKNLRYERVVLQVGESTKRDFALEVQGTTEVVCVDCGVDMRPLVNTDSSATAEVVTEREKDSLPLNGRNFLEL